MEISAIKSRSAALEEGRWVEDVPGFPGVRLKVRSSVSPTVRSALGRMVREIPRSRYNADGSIPDEIGAEIDIAVFSGFGLLDWGGITDGGKPLPFDPDTAAALMAAAWQFKDAVSYAMRAVAVDAEAKTEEIEGN